MNLGTFYSTEPHCTGIEIRKEAFRNKPISEKKMLNDVCPFLKKIIFPEVRGKCDKIEDLLRQSYILTPS